MGKAKDQEAEFPFAAADVAAQLVRWVTHLGAERRMSALTVEAYRGDVARFLAFLAEHLGGGGHECASGFAVEGPLAVAVARVIELVRAGYPVE